MTLACGPNGKKREGASAAQERRTGPSREGNRMLGGGVGDGEGCLSCVSHSGNPARPHFPGRLWIMVILQMSRRSAQSGTSGGWGWWA